jgi:hypothetical protein
MTTQLDIYLKFPADDWDEKQYNKLRKACGSVEHVESNFGIEFSCGEGKYLSDELTDEELEKYDGNVSLEDPPRFTESKELFKLNKPYRFTIKYSEKTEEAVFYLNSKEVSREWVG